MKNGVALLFFILIVNQAFGQKKDEIVKNNVKSVIVNEEKNIKGKMVNQKESETYYDSKGNIIEEKEYKDGIIDKHFKYQYDTNNNKIKETEFDKTGKAIKIIEYKYQGSLRTERIAYDGNGNLKSKKTYKYEKFQ